VNLPPLPEPRIKATKDEGFSMPDLYSAYQLQQYAAQAVAEERERCAKLCDELERPIYDFREMSDFQWAARVCASAIRSQK
jgi:hypothetical protein